MAANLEKSCETKSHEVPVLNRGGCHSPEVTLADGFRFATWDCVSRGAAMCPGGRAVPRFFFSELLARSRLARQFVEYQ